MGARASVDPWRVLVRSSAWLDGGRGFTTGVEQDRSGKDGAFASWKSVNQSWEKNATSKWALRSEDFSGGVALGATISLANVSPGTRTTI